MTNFLKKTGLLAFLLLANIANTWAQSSQVANVALYDGADRQQRLVAEAKKEGSLTLYTSLTPKNLDVLRADFEKKYGIKINVWRAGGDKIVQRVMSEMKAGKAGFDLVHIDALEMEELHRENTLQ